MSGCHQGDCEVNGMGQDPTSQLKKSIFDDDAPWQADIDLAWSHDWGGYVVGYKEAADRLVESITEDHFDPLVYPILFLYRQYLELLLKHLLRIMRRLQGVQGESISKEEQDSDKKLFESHELESLWKKVRDLIETLWGDHEDMAANVDAEARIREFSQIDYSSQNFRYPENKKGKSTLDNYPTRARGGTRLNCINVQRVVDALEARLGGAWDKAEEQIQTVNGMREY